MTNTARLALSLIAASGLATPAAFGAAQPAKAAPATAHAEGSLSQDQMLRKADAIRAALDLSAYHDADSIINKALNAPLRFTSKRGSREFTGEVIVRAQRTKGSLARATLAPSTVKASAFVDEFTVKVPQGVTEGEFAAVLMETGDYRYAEPNWTLFPLAVPNDSQYSSSWQHNRLESAAAWDLHTGTSDIIVAVCDSGVDTNHPDLVDALIPGYNAVNNRAQVDGGEVEDVNGHGTFVSGCAAAQGNNGTGVAGVGWDFSIMPIRVSNNSGGTANAFDILEGARWAAENGAQIVNASFSGGTSSANQGAANDILRMGGLFFWASGNDGQYLGANDAIDLVLVGSSTSSDRKSGFSNYGPPVDVIAPGSGVRSTRNGGTYGNSSGTSYASPIAAGVGAIIFSANEDLSPWDVQDVLYQSVDDLGAAGRDDTYARGRVNSFNAVSMAQSYQPRYLLPLNESFDDSSWNDRFETESGSPSIASGSLSLGSGDSIVTVPLAGRSLPVLRIPFSMSIDASGANPGDRITVEHTLEDGSWTELYSYEAYAGSPSGPFSVELVIENTFAFHGTKLRISADGSGSQWSIDNIALVEETTTELAPFDEDFETGVFSNVLWIENIGAEAAVSQGTYAAALDGADVIKTNDINMLPFGPTISYVRFDAWKSAGADENDTVLVEVRGRQDEWATLGTIDGASLTESAQPFEFQTPFFVWGAEEARLRFTAASDDAIYLDNIELTTELAMEECVPDINGDGTLDFFDVSQFLSEEIDYDGNTIFDFFDLSTFLGEFGQGCP